MSSTKKSPEYGNYESYGHAGGKLFVTAVDLAQLAWRKKVDQVETAISLGERAQQAVANGQIPPENADEFLGRIGDVIARNPLLPWGFRHTIQNLMLMKKD